MIPPSAGRAAVQPGEFPPSLCPATAVEALADWARAVRPFILSGPFFFAIVSSIPLMTAADRPKR